MIPLSQLLAGDRPDETPVAERAGRILNLGQLRRDVAANAARFAGTRRAALHMQDSYGFLVGLFALLQAGAEIVLPPNGQAGSLDAAEQEAGLLVTDGVLVEAGADHACSPLDPAACRLDFFTSGSTGVRKRIAKTLGQLEREIAVLEALWGAELGTSKILGMVPHQHIFGLTFRLLWPLSAGRVFGAAAHFAWETLLPELTGPTALVVSPAHLARLGGIEAVPPERRPNLILTAGAPVSAQAAEEAATLLGQAPTEIFGSTETGAIAWRRQSGSATGWQPLPGVELEIGAEGTLRIRSPFLPAGEHYDSPDRVEAEGAGFRFRGRSDRVVKIEGKRIGLPEIEAELRALPEIADCAVALLAERRDLLGAVIVLSAQGQAALAQTGKRGFEQQLRQALARTQEAAGLPRRWRFVDTLPTDGMGKPDRAAILALLAPAPVLEPVLRGTQTTERGIVLDLLVPPDLLFFEGHFATYPILPGVVQLDWAVDYARRYLQVDGTPGPLSQLKFRRPVRPRDALVLRLEREVSGGRDWVVFEYHRGEEACSSGRIAFGAP